jgi:hypothetical protein
MAEQDQGSSSRQGMPGGREHEGSGTGPGTEQVQVDVPPYDDRKQGFDAEDEERTHKAFDAENAPPPGPAAPVSDEERTGVSSTDLAPEPALGVGESTGRRAEDIAPDRPDTESKGAGRPAGKADDDEAF